MSSTIDLLRRNRRAYLALAVFLAIVLASLLTAALETDTLHIQAGVVWLEASDTHVWYFLTDGTYVKQEFRKGEGLFGMDKLVIVEHR